MSQVSDGQVSTKMKLFKKLVLSVDTHLVLNRGFKKFTSNPIKENRSLHF